MKLITVLTPCFNEQENVEPLYEAVRAVFATLPNYRYEHLFIDNASTDRTVDILRSLAARDSNVKVIVNARNFGPVRSPFHGLLQARGDAVIGMVADFQDPPELIPDLIAKWEQGFKAVNYSKLSLLTIQAVKEQQVQIESQQAQIDQQRKQIDQQRGQIERLTKIVCAMNSKADLCR